MLTERVAYLLLGLDKTGHLGNGDFPFPAFLPPSFFAPVLLPNTGSPTRVAQMATTAAIFSAVVDHMVSSTLLGAVNGGSSSEPAKVNGILPRHCYSVHQQSQRGFYYCEAKTFLNSAMNQSKLTLFEDSDGTLEQHLAVALLPSCEEVISTNAAKH
uniref:Uncharacterized protein n=1 Tax=Salvator merianae TaxID=96440 RepID=A0A8D0BVX7_SALMN